MTTKEIKKVEEEYSYYRYEEGINTLCDALWTAKQSLVSEEDETPYDAYYDVEWLVASGAFAMAKERFDARVGAKEGKRLDACRTAFANCFALADLAF